MTKKKENKPIGTRKLLREHRYVFTLNAQEDKALHRYIKKYKVQNKSKLFREVLMYEVISRLEKDSPTLFENGED